MHNSTEDQLIEKLFATHKQDQSIVLQLPVTAQDQSVGQLSGTSTPNHLIGQPSSISAYDQSMGQLSGVSAGDQSFGKLSIISTQDQSIKQDKVVCFDDEEIIIGYLKETKDELDVICITGMPGKGKSTLAWMICENEYIVKEFEFRIWVNVSQEFNSRDVFLSILNVFAPQGMFNATEQELIPTVLACLGNKKFFLVLDGVWRIQDWQVIQQILPYANGQGKVLVTTREQEVGVHANTTNSREPHRLKKLTPEKSWELLQLKVFGNLNDCPSKLCSLGLGIASQCHGVPLMIVVVGGILKSQFIKTRSIYALEEDWSKVLQNVSEISLQHEENRISNAIALSYKKMPNELRECFLYLGVFRKNDEISASTLIQLWIAEGLVIANDRQSSEEAGEHILDDLIKMHLLMVGKKHLEKVKTCRVHDMIGEFCRSKAKEENFFQVIRKSNGLIAPPVAEVLNFHRVSLHSDLYTFLSANPKGPSIRTLLFFSKEAVHMEKEHIQGILHSFNVLRVFKCNSIKLSAFPDFTKLILLKHISLSIDHLQVLPEQVSELLNLQALEIETKSRSITVKANIWKMPKLRIIKTEAAMSLDDKKWKVEAHQGNIQKLTSLSPKSCTTLCVRAPGLKMLGIRGKLDNVLDTMSLEKLGHLEKIKLVNDLAHQSASENPLLRFPQPQDLPPNLKEMTLSKTYLSWDRHMPILAKINSLKILKLKDNAFTGISWRACGDGFESLQSLLIQDSELVIWEPSPTHFQRLRRLVLKECLKIQGIPGNLIPNLDELEIEHVHKLAVDSAKKIEAEKKESEKQNRTSICRVPFKLIIGPGCN